MREGAPGNISPETTYGRKKKLINGLCYFIRSKYNDPVAWEIEKDWSRTVSEYYVKKISLETALEEFDRILEKLKSIALELGASEEELSERNLEFYDILDKRDAQAFLDEKDITEH